MSLFGEIVTERKINESSFNHSAPTSNPRCCFITLTRPFMSCPHSHMEEKYDPCGFSLQLSTDDQFHRTYFKPCWPHTGHRHHACWRYHAGMMEQSMNWKYHSVKNEIPRIRAKTALVLCFTWVRDGWGRTEMNDSQMYELILKFTWGHLQFLLNPQDLVTRHQQPDQFHCLWGKSSKNIRAVIIHTVLHNTYST